MDESGASSTFAFLFAGVLFIAGISAVMVNTQSLGDEAASATGEGQLLQQQALAIRDLLLHSPGHAVDVNGEDVDWIAPKEQDGDRSPADGLQRLGLMQAGGVSLDFNKLVNLRGAEYAADDSDGYVNYEEARASLGLDDHGFDFHVRAYPSLRSVQELLGQGIKDENLRVTYIGDATGQAEAQAEASSTPPTIGTPTCSLSQLDARSIRVTVPVTNTGETTTQFQASLRMDVAGKQIEDTQWGPLVDPDETVQIDWDHPAAHGECDDVIELEVAILDPSATLVEEAFEPSWPAAGASTASNAFRVDPAADVFVVGDPVKVVYDGDLTYEKGNKDGEDVTLTIRDDDGDVAYGPTSMQVPKKNDDWAFTLQTSDLDDETGAYEILFTRANGETASDVLVIVNDLPDNFIPDGGDASAPTSYTYSEAAQVEVGFLDTLVHRFCPSEWDSKAASPADASWSVTTWNSRCDTGLFRPHQALNDQINQPGDVFPDDKQLLQNYLQDRLIINGVPSTEMVTTLVVGSDVDHKTMTSDHVKGVIGEWVTEGGGQLIVFGSDKQVVNWLRAVFQTKLDSASTGLTAPDSSHPILQVTDDLAWDEYDDRGRAWDLTHPSASGFTKVVHDDSVNKNAIMAISDPGAYGAGTVILTSWLPYDLFGDGATCPENTPCEGLKIVNNMLMQGYRDLFVDYGPRIPGGVAVVPADGRAQVYHPELERFITLTLRVYVFPA